jgi:hypothetical protein
MRKCECSGDPTYRYNERMRRRLLNFLTALSLLLCVAVVALWVRGTAIMNASGCRNGRHSWCVGYDSGGVAVGHCPATPPVSSGGDAAYWEWNTAVPSSGPLAKAGLEWGRVNVTRQTFVLSGLAVLGRLFQVPTPAQYVKLPWWSLSALTATAPATRGLSAYRRRRRKHAGRCSQCGYDLRATPDRCPECGTKPTM